MAVQSRRSRLPVRVLLAAGVVALAAAGCASQGVTPGAVGSQTATASGSATSTLPTDAGSTSASGQDSSAAPSDTGSTSLPDADTSSSVAPAGQVYKLTDTVTEGGFKIKIHSATMPYNPPAGSFFTPGPTREWLLLDFEVTNVSGGQLMFSTIGAFDMRDSANASYLTEVGADDDLKDKAFQDHEMNPGDTSRGELIFDLSQKASGYRLIFKGNMWHASQTPPSITMGF
ncbi:DUF4352 domain-containing protein [Catenulispora sp. GP43]|uniref:DUF4352 domain-containing protein n=1 Tax=Catenulispora sp. GP43 TaxID=3156263 RepID=UPI003515A3C7